MSCHVLEQGLVDWRSLSYCSILKNAWGSLQHLSPVKGKKTLVLEEKSKLLITLHSAYVGPIVLRKFRKNSQIEKGDWCFGRY